MRGVTGILVVVGMVALVWAAEKKEEEKPSGDLAPLKIELPKPLFSGTPKNPPAGTTVEKPSGKPRPPFMAPKGVEVVSAKKVVTSSDDNPVSGKLEMVTDGNKEGSDGNWVELG